MSQYIFTIGSEGKRLLETIDGEPVAIERKPPSQHLHFSAINDLRIAAELAGGLQYFYAAWELPGIGWNDALIPDAILALDNKVFAIEFDTGSEGVRFFVRSKMPAYGQGLNSLTPSAVLIVADRTARMLAKAIGDQRSKVLFTTLDLIVEQGFRSPVFYALGDGWGRTFVARPLLSDSPADKRFFSTQHHAYQ
jgi:hypothetical protein